MHNHLGKQLVIRDSKSADLTPYDKTTIWVSMCTCSQKLCYATIYDLYKVQQCIYRNIYISVKTVTRSYIISIYSVKTVTRSTHRQTSNSYCIAPSTQPNINVKYNFSWFTWYTICCKKIDPGNMGQLIQY